MALNHAPTSDTHATHCSLRRADRTSALHPLKQNPPSIIDAADFTSFDDVDIDGPLRPPPSALTTAATHYDPHESPLPLDSYSPARIGQTHHRSLTDTFFDNCQPFISRATSTLQQHTSRASLHSPTKSLASFIPSRSTITSPASPPKFKASAKALSNWFNGSSAPVSVGLAAPEAEDSDSEEYDSEDDGDREPTMMASIFNRGSALTGSGVCDTTPKRPAPTPTKSQTPSSTANSRFAWLLSTPKNSGTPPSAPSPTKYHNPDDELLNLNISQSLFPHGPVDPLEPSAFNDLLSAAETLLTRYQNSYRQLSSALRDSRAEQDAQEDELDEAETRVRHLKMQLETMAARASEQDAQMQRLNEELMFERRARQEEEAARKRSLALVRAASHDDQKLASRRNRISNSDVSVDSGFESECDTDAASIFSRTNCLSPTGTTVSSAVSLAEDIDITPKHLQQRPQPVVRRSTYDRMRDGSIDVPQVGLCRNCEGGSQASVWGRLAKEREESNALRARVEALEAAVDGALHVVDRPWGM